MLEKWTLDGALDTADALMAELELRTGLVAALMEETVEGKGIRHIRISLSSSTGLLLFLTRWTQPEATTSLPKSKFKWQLAGGASQQINHLLIGLVRLPDPPQCTICGVKLTADERKPTRWCNSCSDHLVGTMKTLRCPECEQDYGEGEGGVICEHCAEPTSTKEQVMCSRCADLPG